VTLEVLSTLVLYSLSLLPVCYEVEKLGHHIPVTMDPLKPEAKLNLSFFKLFSGILVTATQ
jgi:hypothetical protein